MMRKLLYLSLFFAMMVVSLRGEEGGGAAVAATSLKNERKSNETHNDVAVNDNKKSNNGGGGGGGGGGVGWGWGGGGGGGNKRGGWGWGSGGGGGVYWRWGCNGRQRVSGKKRVFPAEDYRMGEFAQCVVKGSKCKGMRLDCPLHCGGPCVYDCRNMCKAHCKS